MRVKGKVVKNTSPSLAVSLTLMSLERQKTAALKPVPADESNLKGSTATVLKAATNKDFVTLLLNPTSYRN